MLAVAQIRRERPDHPQVLALLAELDRYLDSLYPPEANHILSPQALLAPEVDFLVASLEGDIVACGAARRMRGDPDTDGLAYGEVKRMMTAPAHRGRGLAEQLMAALESGLQAHGITLALLETGRDQSAAVKLYERLGYVRRGPFGGYPDNGLSLFYGKRLG
jgi:putative acetyltransferase